MESISELRKIPVDKLLQILNEKKGYGIFMPEAVEDGSVFTSQIFEIFKKGEQHNVPILLGFNSGEANHLAAYKGWTAPVPISIEAYEKAVGERYGCLKDDYLSLYKYHNYRDVIFSPVRDGFYGWASSENSENNKSNQFNPDVYLYYFDHAPEWSNKS